MADGEHDDKKVESGPSTAQDSQARAEARFPSSSSSSAEVKDRSQLLEQARSFLASPNIVNEAPDAKRNFLAEKGIHEDEIDMLLRNAAPPQPTIPPRTYPQPPPSNLPYLLLGLTKIFSWVTGCSAVLILIYYRFLLPRITRSALARKSLKQHQVSLLKNLNSSLESLKRTQDDSFSDLPKADPFAESPEHAQIHTLEKLELTPESLESTKPHTILRCVIEGSAASGKKLTWQEIFALLEQKYPWFMAEDRYAEYEIKLFETLTTNPCFASLMDSSTEPKRIVYIYTSPFPPSPTPLLSSLNTLKSSFSSLSSHSGSESGTRPAQRTLEALADCTGYITTQTYQLTSAIRAHGFGGFGGFGTQVPLFSPQQEEIRKEIKALKGLVLNRRTFAPARPKPISPLPGPSPSD